MELLAYSKKGLLASEGDGANILYLVLNRGRARRVRAIVSEITPDGIVVHGLSGSTLKSFSWLNRDASKLKNDCGWNVLEFGCSMEKEFTADSYYEYITVDCVKTRALAMQTA